MSNIPGVNLVNKLVAFDVDGTLIEGNSQRLLIWHLARNGMLPWPVLTQALWWFTKYQLHLAKDTDVAMNKVLGIFAGLPISKMENLLNEFCTTLIFPRLRKEAIAEIIRHRAAGQKVILVSSSIDYIVQLICEYVGADGWVATKLEIIDGRLSGRISGRAVYSKEKFPSLQRYANTKYGAWMLDVAYGDHSSDALLLEQAINPIAVCPDSKLIRIARLKGWRVVKWCNTRI
jgi:HAD superfamily hydrolase (TIGR01490 family)